MLSVVYAILHDHVGDAGRGVSNGLMSSLTAMIMSTNAARERSPGDDRGRIAAAIHGSYKVDRIIDVQRAVVRVVDSNRSPVRPIVSV